MRFGRHILPSRFESQAQNQLVEGCPEGQLPGFNIKWLAIAKPRVDGNNLSIIYFLVNIFKPTVPLQTKFQHVQNDKNLYCQNILDYMNRCSTVLYITVQPLTLAWPSLCKDVSSSKFLHPNSTSTQLNFKLGVTLVWVA